MSREPLEVRYNGRPVAQVFDHGLGVCSLQYDDSAGSDPSVALSVRLPPRSEPYSGPSGVKPFLDGLLPEGWVRSTLADQARIAASDTFGLLARYGRDCAGALAFVDPGEPEPADGVQWLTAEELDRTVNALRVAPLGTLLERGARISLGGVQEKMVVVIDGERLGVPVGATPSTHILKPTQLAPDGSERFPGIVDVEHFCLRLAGHVAAERHDPIRGIAFKVPPTKILRIADRDALCVQRYDRTVTHPTSRIHQEDGCQVLGLPPDQKYQTVTHKDPSLAGFAAAILRFGADPMTDLRALLQLLVLTVCVGNADLHAKNLSLLHLDGVRLAPIYDVVSTSIYVGVSPRNLAFVSVVSTTSMTFRPRRWSPKPPPGALDRRRHMRQSRRPLRRSSKLLRRCEISSAPKVAITRGLMNSRLAWCELRTHSADLAEATCADPDLKVGLGDIHLDAVV